MFKIEFTGTGGALPLKNRGMSAALLSHNGRKLLFDCGEGTQQSLLHLRSGFVNIDMICLSHLHGDHVFGLPGLLCTMGVSGRSNDLLLVAPEGSFELLSRHLALVGNLPFGVYLLELGESELSALPHKVLTESQSASNSAKAVSAIAFSLTRQGYKIDIKRSDARLLNSHTFRCLLRNKQAAKVTKVNVEAEIKEGADATAEPSLTQLYPDCKLFVADEGLNLLKACRLNKKIQRYSDLQVEAAANEFTDLYLSAKKQKHSVPCIAFRCDWFKKGTFAANRACLKGIPKEFWSLLQNNYTVSYRLQNTAYHFEPLDVLDSSRLFFSLAYVTDTRPLAANATFLAAADLLISESNYAEEDKLPLAVKNMHMTMKEACEQAQAADVKELILTHFSAGLTEPEQYLAYAATFFPQVKVAHDLDEFLYLPPNRVNSDYALTQRTHSEVLTTKNAEAEPELAAETEAKTELETAAELELAGNCELTENCELAGESELANESEAALQAENTAATSAKAPATAENTVS